MATLRYTGRVDDNGSLIISKETLAELGIRPGDTLLVSLNPGSGNETSNRASVRPPNQGILDTLRRVEEIQRGMCPKPGRDSVEIIREGRAGAMWGYDPAE